MGFLFKFLFITILFLKLDSFNCPRGSDEVPREDVCVVGINQPKFYFDASRDCVSRGGVTAKIQNLYENSFIFTLIDQDVNGTAPYIGIERKPNNIWVYADGSPLIYLNWALGEPNLSSNTSVCAIMNPQNGKWHSAECFLVRPYFCSFNGDDFQCPNGWIYSNITDHCYYLQNFTYTDAVHWQLYSKSTAETICQRMGKDSHLVSIHSFEENELVWDLVYSNVANMSNVAPENKSCAYQWTWIGYYGNCTLGAGKWTDGSPDDFVYYGPISSSYDFVISYDPSCHLQQWNPTTSTGYPRFVCKMPSRGRIARGNNKKRF